MILTSPQATVARDTHRFRVLRWGRRTGKTHLIVEEIKGRAVSKPSRIAYIANNYGQARDIAWEILKKELKGIIIDANESRLEIKVRTVKGGESLIILRGWEAAENLRGQAFDLLCIDEVASMRNFWSIWHEVLRPTLTDRKGAVIFASTPKGYNHFFDLCNEELKDHNFKTFHFTSYDNPHLPKEEIDTAKASLPVERFEQEYMASFQKTAGLVYKEFSREKHVILEMPKHAKLFDRVAGVDFGYRNPAAVIEIYTDGDWFYIENEFYKRERTDAQVAEYVAAQRFESVFPDPESAGGIEELRQRRVNVREVTKGPGSIVAGINLVREKLIINRLKVNARCINVISEFETYSHEDESDDDRNQKEKPISAHNHAMDAIRYVVTMTSGSKPTAQEERDLDERRKEMLDEMNDNGI